MSFFFKADDKNKVKINHLFVNGVTSEDVVSAFLKYSRENFLPEELQFQATTDSVVVYQKDRFMIEIATLAAMVNLLQIKSTDKVLLVGSGLGYSSAIVSEFTNSVIGLDIDSDIIKEASDNLKKLEVNNVKFIQHDDLATFDYQSLNCNKIIIEGASSPNQLEILKNMENGTEVVAIERLDNLAFIVKIIIDKHELIKSYHMKVATPYLVGFSKKLDFVF